MIRATRSAADLLERVEAADADAEAHQEWLLEREAARLAIVGCLFCGRRDLGRHDVVCGRCRRELQPTPLDEVLSAFGWTEREFSEITGIPRRTVIRAAQGVPVGDRTAERLEEATGIEAAIFVEGVEVRWE